MDTQLHAQLVRSGYSTTEATQILSTLTPMARSYNALVACVEALTTRQIWST